MDYWSLSCAADSVFEKLFDNNVNAVQFKQTDCLLDILTFSF